MNKTAKKVVATGAMLNGILGLFEKKVAPWRYRDNG